MQATYIFGHRNPDTDSICSSIALSYLKNKLGDKTIPKTIGHLNNETKFVLKYFNVTEPQYLNDVRIRVKSVKYDKKGIAKKTDCLYQIFQKMQMQNVSGISVVDDDKKLLGFVSLKDLSKYLIMGEKEYVDASLNNVALTLNGEVITKSNDNIKGNIIVAGTKSETLFENELTDQDILIVGDRFKIIEHAIDCKVNLIVLSNGCQIDKALVKKAKENKVSVIRSKLSSFQIANRISLSNYIDKSVLTENPVTVKEDDYYADFLSLASRYNHTNYPVVNRKGECLGTISLSWPNSHDKQKVILVDHNNFSQSVIGIEEAEILEIIDHHNLGEIGTSIPINFTSKPVGCTATIVYQLFTEKRVSIPKYIAGLLVSAIISDTLLLTSPTTTDEDKKAAEKLAKIAKINLNKYGYEMLKAASSIKGLSINEQIYRDYKSYTVGPRQLGIGQLMTMDFEEIEKNIDEYVEKLNEMRTIRDGIYALFITDVIKNGSYIIYNKASEDIIKESFGLDEIYEGVFLKGYISRKKQFIPAIMNILDK